MQNITIRKIFVHQYNNNESTTTHLHSLLLDIHCCQSISCNRSDVFLFLFLTLSIIFTGLTSVIKCGTNEVYQCGSPCIHTCTTKPQLCIATCSFGCFCADGYVRESEKNGSACIKPEDCPKTTDKPTCGTNEEYQECGSACSATCDDLRYPLPKPPKVCPMICIAGCSCKKGYYRASDGQCVPPEKCCGENERYKECGSSCVETCNDKPKMCQKMCVSGCFCSCSDYVRTSNTTNSPCIHRDDCPVVIRKG